MKYKKNQTNKGCAALNVLWASTVIDHRPLLDKNEQSICPIFIGMWPILLYTTSNPVGTSKVFRLYTYEIPLSVDKHYDDVA